MTCIAMPESALYDERAPLGGTMVSKPTRPSTSQQEEVQWKSPILIGSLLFGLIVFTVWVALFLLPRLAEDRSEEASPKINPIGVPVDEKKTTTEMGALVADSPQKNLLVISSLRTTHTGFLANKTLLDTTNPNDFALILELSQPEGGASASFNFTLSELPTIRYLLVTRNGTRQVSLDDLEVGYGVGITRIKNLMNNNEPDEIVIEITL